MDAEKFIETIAFQRNMSLPDVRGVMNLYGQLNRVHGAIGSADMLARLRATVDQALEVGGDPRVALAAVHGLDAPAATLAADLTEHARRQADSA